MSGEVGMHSEIQPGKDAAPDWCVLEATDADLHAHNLRNWQQQYDQLSGGGFYGRIDELALSQLQIFHEYTSQALKQQCNVWPDSVWIGFSADGRDCRINGEQVAAEQLMVRPGDTEFQLLTPQQFDIYGIVVSREVLQRVADTTQLDWHGDRPAQVRVGWSRERLQALRYAMQRLLTPTHAGLSGHLQQDWLLGAVVDILQQPQVADDKPALARRRQVVARVQAYLQAQPLATPSVTDLCELTHVSRRTLQYCFEQVLGLSPLQYLRLMRLNAVRRLLLVGLEEGDTIAQLAARYGFWHAGQFSADYKGLFGEPPSATLARAGQ